MINYKYEINLCSAFVENKKLLYTLYLPIIGKKALEIYEYFMYEYNENSRSIFENKNHENFLKINGLNWDEFLTLRKLLEAVNLMNTYLNDVDKKIIYVLKEPLSYDEFINDAKMFSVLKNRVSKEELSKIHYSLKMFTHNHNMVDISESIDYLITETEQRDVFMYNFEKLFLKLTAEFHTTFDFSYEIKKSIDDLYNDYRLSFDEIYQIIFNSVIETTNGYSIGIDLLKNKINLIREQKTSEKLLKTLSVKRDSNIFDFNNNINDYQHIIDEYKNHKTENYIVITTKTSINEATREWIDILRNKYNFDDAMINAIVDYTIIKNTGALHKNYILKIANSISYKTIDNVLDTVIYLRSTKMLTKTNVLAKTLVTNIEEVIENKKENNCEYSNYDEAQMNIIKLIG